MSKFISGAALLVWQLLAFIFAITGVADLVLTSWPDPAWFPLIISIALSPPKWLVVLAVTLGTLLCFWAFDEHQRKAKHR